MVIDPDGETGTVVDDAGHSLERGADAARAADARGRGAARRAGRAAGVGEQGGRAHRERAGRRDRLDEAVGRRTSWRSRRATGWTSPRRRRAGFIWPDFLPAYDATATLVKLLDLLAVTGHKLSEIVATLPVVHIAHETVPTPWERKGAIMREMVERAKGRDVVLVDGVKILHPDGWALVLPGSRGADRARVGRGRHATTRRPSSRPSTPGASPRSSDAPDLDVVSRIVQGATERMEYPEELRYSKEHEWVRVEGTRGDHRHHRLRPGRAR